MNPRIFCAQPDYPSVLALTYGFDPLFFERIALPALWAGGASDVLVLADQRCLDEQAARWSGQLRHLGKNYLLSGAKTAGAFHPKVLLRLGPRGAMVWVGSGNISFGGWGNNRELATAWRVGPGLDDEGGWLVGFLRAIEAWCGGEDGATGVAASLLARSRDLPWLSESSTTSAAPILWSEGRRSLASHVASRWQGRHFHTLRMRTGSTDTAGALLDWSSRTFGVERAVIGVDPQRADFDPEKLDALPLDVRIVPMEPFPLMHAKCLLLEGEQGAAALVGSANCSAAAFLLAPDSGGNIEVVVPYDEVEPDGISVMAELRASEGERPSSLLVVRQDEGDGQRPPGPRYRLSGLQWNSLMERLEVLVDPCPPPTASVEIDLEGEHIALRFLGDGEPLWCSASSVDLDFTTTPFGRVRIVDEDGVFLTPLHWVDQVHELTHSRRGRALGAAVGLLGTGSTTDEQARLIEELHIASNALFDDPAAFADPISGIRKRSGGDRQGAPGQDPVVRAPSLDPEALVVSLGDDVDTALGSGGLNVNTSLPLLGVMRALFGAEESSQDVDEDDLDEDELGGLDDDDEKESEAPCEEPGTAGCEPDSGGGTTAPPAAPPDEVVRRQLSEQLESFIGRLTEEKFVSKCSARQLVQAICYPLVVAMVGRRGGWVSDEDACRWTVLVLERLFHWRRRHNDPIGMLAGLQARYVAMGKEDVFRHVVGDGTLWLAISSALVGLPWRGRALTMQAALLIRDAYECREFVSAVDAGRLAWLIGKLQVDNDHRTVTQFGPRIAAAVRRLEGWLEPRFDGLLREQQSRGGRHHDGDPLWSPRAGWAFATEDARIDPTGRLRVHLRRSADEVKIKAAGFYVNVARAAEGDEEFAKLWKEVQRVFAGDETSS